MPSYQTLRVGVCPNTSSYVHQLNGLRLFAGSDPGEGRSDFFLRTVPLEDDPEYRTVLWAHRCHFYVEVLPTFRRRTSVMVRRLTYVANGLGRTHKLYVGRGGGLGIRDAVAALAGRRLPPPSAVAGKMSGLLEAMGERRRAGWLAAVRSARSTNWLAAVRHAR